MLTLRTVGRRERGGPCTDEGKARTRLNALKHGLASCNSHDQLYFESTKKVAAAICGGQDDPLLFEQALVIAECDQLLRRIHLEQLGALERLEDCLANPVAGSYAKDASRDLEKLQVYERRARSRRTRAISNVDNNQNPTSLKRHPLTARRTRVVSREGETAQGEPSSLGI